MSSITIHPPGANAANIDKDDPRAFWNEVLKGDDIFFLSGLAEGDIGFDSSLNEIVLVSSKGEQLVSRRSKQACAAAILDTLGNQTAGAAVEQRTTV
jgi:hypothetical protein